MRLLLPPLLCAVLCCGAAHGAPRWRSRVFEDAAASADAELRPLANALLASAGPALSPVESDARLRPAATSAMLRLRDHQGPLSSPLRTGEEAPRPRELVSRNGALTVHLTFGLANVSTPGGTLPLRCFTVDGDSAPSVPGPTLRVRPGDVLTLVVRNALPATAPRCLRTHLATDPQGESEAGCFNTFHEPNTLNIHTHGLHVSPLFDDVFISQPPGTTHTYRFPIERNHVPGTAWWHPHHHGSASLHVGSGAAGVIIVDPPEEEYAETVLYSDEEVLILQEFRFNGLVSLLSVLNASFAADYEDALAAVAQKCGFEPATHNPSSWRAQLNPNCTFVTVNGALRPTLRLRALSWTRLRIVAATWTSTAGLAVRGAGCSAAVLALDGIPLRRAPVPLDEAGGRVLLAPGQRVDLAVRCSPTVGGDAALVAMPRDAAVNASFGAWFQQWFPNDVTREPLVLADILLSPPLALRGATAVAGLSDAVPALPPSQSSYVVDDLRALPVAQRHSWLFDARLLCLRTVNASNCEELPGGSAAPRRSHLVQRVSERFAVSAHPSRYIAGFDADGLDDITSIFFINGQVYRGAGAPAITARVGEIHEWEFRAGWVSPHIIHLHATPFQLLSYEPESGGNATQAFMEGQWMDSVLVPAGGRVVLRLRFAAVGPTMLHCHTILHHDVGMAAVIDVQGPVAQ